MLWVDKYRPNSLDQLDYHPKLTQQLQNLARGNEFPHLMVYGPSGAGKKTRVMALLKEIYGSGVFKMRLEHKAFTYGTSKTKVEITTLASNYHIEINPSDVGIRDRYVVQEVIKEIAQYHLVDLNSQKNFKVVVLTEVDCLSKQAQHALRRTMEKHTVACRLILICNNASKVIDPVRSRCVGIRVGAPQINEICRILNTICDREYLQSCKELSLRIAEVSERNVRRAILMLEACKVQQLPLTENQNIQLPDWEEYIGTLAMDIIQDQSPQALLKAREKVYELLSNCIPAVVIIKTLCRELLKRLDDEIKYELMHWAAFYEHRLHCGAKDIFHIEAFIAKFMMLYKKFLIDIYF